MKNPAKNMGKGKEGKKPEKILPTEAENGIPKNKNLAEKLLFLKFMN